MKFNAEQFEAMVEQWKPKITMMEQQDIVDRMLFECGYVNFGDQIPSNGYAYTLAKCMFPDGSKYVVIFEAHRPDVSKPKELVRKAYRIPFEAPTEFIAWFIQYLSKESAEKLGLPGLPPKVITVPRPGQNRN